MAKFSPDQAQKRGDLAVWMGKVDAKLRQLETSSGLASASFGPGNLRVAKGGNIQIDDGGGMTVRGGGAIRIYDGGQLRMYHPGDQASAVEIGTFQETTGTHTGLTVFDPREEQIFTAFQTRGGANLVINGDPSRPLDTYYIESEKTYINGYGDGSKVVIDAQYVDLNTTGPNGWVSINPDSNKILVHTQAGTGDAAVFGGADGDGARQLYYQTSSRKYKQDIADFDPEPDAVLKLRPRSWRYIDQARNLGDACPTAYGFIAEEVEEAGLSGAVTYSAGEPEGISDRAVSAGLVSLCQRQQREIDELKAAVAALIEGVPDGMESS